MDEIGAVFLFYGRNVLVVVESITFMDENVTFMDELSFFR
jgi:hypothetical protein